MYKSQFIKEIFVTDPHTGAEVQVEIHKDLMSGGIFGIDATYLEQVNNVINNPFSSTGDNLILLDEPK